MNYIYYNLKQIFTLNLRHLILKLISNFCHQRLETFFFQPGTGKVEETVCHSWSGGLLCEECDGERVSHSDQNLCF